MTWPINELQLPCAQLVTKTPKSILKKINAAGLTTGDIVWLCVLDTNNVPEMNKTLDSLMRPSLKDVDRLKTQTELSRVIRQMSRSVCGAIRDQIADEYSTAWSYEAVDWTDTHLTVTVLVGRKE